MANNNSQMLHRTGIFTYIHFTQICCKYSIHVGLFNLFANSFEPGFPKSLYDKESSHQNCTTREVDGRYIRTIVFSKTLDVQLLSRMEDRKLLGCPCGMSMKVNKWLVSWLISPTFRTYNLLI